MAERSRLIAEFTDAPLLITDDTGTRKLPASGAEVGDTPAVAAFRDRLIRHGHPIEIRDKSYRRHESAVAARERRRSPSPLRTRFPQEEVPRFRGTSSLRRPVIYQCDRPLTAGLPVRYPCACPSAAPAGWVPAPRRRRTRPHTGRRVPARGPRRRCGGAVPPRWALGR